MPVVREYRIVLPFSVEEYKRGRKWPKIENMRRWSDAVNNPVSKSTSRSKLLVGNAVHVREQMKALQAGVYVKEETDEIPFFGRPVGIEDLGTVTHYIKRKKIDDANWLEQGVNWVEGMIRREPLMIRFHNSDSESWHAYPLYRKVTRNPNTTGIFERVVEIVSLDGNDDLDNALGLPDNILEMREVIHVDFTDSIMEQCDVLEDVKGQDRNPRFFKSEKTGRGPLRKGWQETVKPCMTVYKLEMITIDDPVLGPRAEKGYQYTLFASLTIPFRETFVSMDQWVEKTVDDIEAAKKETYEEFNLAFIKSKREEPLQFQHYVHFFAVLMQFTTFIIIIGYMIKNSLKDVFK